MPRAKKKAVKKESILQAALTLFSVRGFHKTTIPDIARRLGMSSGNLYNYFSSKDELAQEIIKYTSEYLGDKIKGINKQDISSKEKIFKIVKLYFIMTLEKPEMIEYFLRVYLSHREVFLSGCSRMTCVSGVITEIMILFSEGVKKGEFRDQDFFSVLGLFMGYLGSMAFLHGEAVLERSLDNYIKEVTDNIYAALKV